LGHPSSDRDTGQPGQKSPAAQSFPSWPGNPAIHYCIKYRAIPFCQAMTGPEEASAMQVERFRCGDAHGFHFIASDFRFGEILAGHVGTSGLG